MKNKSLPFVSGRQIARIGLVCLVFPAFSALNVAAEEFVEPVVAAVQQAKTVRGTVVDQSGIPIIGANVLVKGTTQGSITDMDGNFIIEGVSPDAQLVITYIGYRSQEVTVGARSEFSIVLHEDTESLDEVVVVGYGTQRKVTVTGSVASVTGEELTASPTSDLTNSMIGRMPGVIGFQTADEPGSNGTTIRIRGTNSIGSKDPLIVIDGVPDRDGGMSRLNPTEIESISVLKDAAAAIYGSRAANGVILITTKRGKEGKPTVTFDASAGFSQPTRTPKMANSYQYAQMINEINPGTYSDEDLRLFQDGSDPWGHPDTDWFDTVLKTASPLYRVNLGVSGGTEKVKYYVNFGANGEDGLYKNSANRYDQYSLRTNLDIELSENVKLSYGTTGRFEYSQYPAKSASSVFAALIRSFPTSVAYWPTGEAGPAIERGDNPAITSTDEAGFDRQKNYYFQNNLSLEIKVPWIEGLTIRGNGSYDLHFYNRRLLESPVVLYSWDGVNYDSSGLSSSKQWLDAPQLTREHSIQNDWMVNGTIDYTRTFGDHTFGIMFGIEAQRNMYEYTLAQRFNYLSDVNPELNLGNPNNQQTEGYSWNEARLNYFGRVSYNYLERYLAEFVWRVDGSYRFPKGHRYGFFPGVSLAWRASEESWWKDNIRFIDYFKLRGSVSQTGNDALLDDDDALDHSIQYLTTYGFRDAGITFGGEEAQRLYMTRVPNTSITWEVGTTYDVGIDMKFLQNRLSLEADAFYHRRTNMLITRDASLSEITGITLPKENLGKMKNRGFEMLVGWNDRVGEVDYYASFNMTYARNKIIYWDETPGVPEYQQSTGMPVGANLYYVADGIFHTQEEIDAYPHWSGAVPGDVKFVDVNGDGVIDANDMVRSDKTAEPRFVGGLTLGLTWRGWDLMALFQGATGAQLYVFTYSGTIGNFLESYYENRWTEENPWADGPRTYERENEYWANPDNQSTMFLRNANYLRLKNLEIGYSFSGDWMKKIGFTKFRIYANGSNLFTIDGVNDVDPESRTDDGHLDTYPLRKVYNFGVQVTF